MKPRFSFLTGDVNWLHYGAKWVSQKLDNTGFDYWIVLELIDMDESCGSDNKGQPRYHVSLSAVSPEQAGPEGCAQAMRSCGWDTEGEPPPALAMVEMLHSYGIQAHLWQGASNNAHKLIRQAKRKAAELEMLVGFVMDRPVNKIGTTGWEAIRGDLNSALARTIASGSIEGQFLAKMHGIKPEDLK